MDTSWDAVIFGGGAAGLSAALVLGRARRRTLLVDAGAQSNLAAHGIGGLLGHDGRPPAELYAMSRKELSAAGATLARQGLLVATTVHQRSDLAGRLGVKMSEGPVTADAIAVDPLCRTTVDGVFAAGDVSAPIPQVANAVAAGSLAAAALMHSLLAEDLALPMPPRR